MKVIIVRHDGTQRVFDLSGKVFVLEQLAKLKALRNQQKPYSFFTTVLAYEIDKQLEAERQEQQRRDQRRYLQTAKGSGKGGLPTEGAPLFDKVLHKCVTTPKEGKKTDG